MEGKEKGRRKGERRQGKGGRVDDRKEGKKKEERAGSGREGSKKPGKARPRRCQALCGLFQEDQPGPGSSVSVLWGRRP